MPWYLNSTKAPGLRFRIAKLNTETKEATLVGPTGVPFQKKITDEVLAEYGYAVIKIEEPETAGA
jgi:hypothetical protein